MRAALTIGLVTLSFLCSQGAFADEDKHANEPGKKKQPKISGTVTKTDGAAGASGVGGDVEAYPQIRDLTLWAVIKWGKSGTSNDFHRVLNGRGPQLSDEDLRKFWADVNDTPAVERRLNEWHTFYDNIVEACRTAVPEIPQKAFFNVNVIVNSDKTLTARTEFFTNSDGIDSEAIAKKLVTALNGLNKTDKIAFPSTSPSMIKFRIQTTGFEQLELSSIGNSLGL